MRFRASSNAERSQRRKSVATWSFRDRPVWSFPASGPSFLWRAPSTKEWTSSAAASSGTPAFPTDRRAEVSLDAPRPERTFGLPERLDPRDRPGHVLGQEGAVEA